MKRTFTLALGLVIGATFATQAFAQDAFPDTPENHWAYEALANMKRAGLLVGYPDGLYRGSRPASRYEMAVALHALYQHFKGIADGYDARLKALEGTPAGGVSKEEFDQLKAMVQAMKADLDSMRGWGDDIANLKKMASTFEKELASMGVDIEALKKGVNDLANRVAALEKRKPAVDIHGDLGLFMLAGYSENDHYGISVDGRPLGVSNGTGAPSSADKDLSVLHEAHFAMTGTNDEGPKWKMVLAIGNMLGGSSFSDGFPSSAAFGNMSHTSEGAAFDDFFDENIYFNEFNAWWDFGFAGQNGTVKVGRQGVQNGKYNLRRPDVTPYYMNEYWDNGMFVMDGASVMFDWGGTSLNVFGGRVADRDSSEGDDITPILAGRDDFRTTPGSGSRPRGMPDGIIYAHRVLGANLKFQLGRANVQFQYTQLDEDDTTGTSAGSVDRAVVFGGEFGFNIGSWMLNAGYSQSNLNLGDTAVINEDNAAYWAGISQDNERWGVSAGWRHIDPLFAAPGDWGRLGIFWNPSDIEGFWLKGRFNLNDTIALHGGYEMYEGSDTDIGGSVGLTSDDEITSFKLDLVYTFSDQLTFWVGTEQVNWDLADRAAPRSGDGTGGFIGGQPEERWWNFGFRYRMTDNAFWSFRWQISDYDSDGVAGWNPFSFSGDPKAQGGLITSTLGIKF